MPIIKASAGEAAGTVKTWLQSAAPNGWIKCNGAAISRTLYAKLFGIIGTAYGVGDGSTTFNLPDFRGEFLRGLDDGRGVDASRALATAQGDAIRNITGDFKMVNANQNASGVFSTYSSANGNGGWGGGTFLSARFDASTVVPTASENRPRNQAALYIIKF